jgi:hypothetical protein
MTTRRAALLAIAAPFLLTGHAFAAPVWAADAAPGLPIWRLLAALLFCIALALAAVVVLRRTKGGASPWGLLRAGPIGGARRIRVVEQAQASVLSVSLVEYSGVEYLVAATVHGVLLLDKRAAQPASSQAPAS